MTLEHALALIEKEQFSEAESICSAYTSGDSLGLRALIAFAKGEHLKVIELATEALKFESQNSPIYRYYLANSLFSMGKLKEGWKHSFQAKIESPSILGRSLRKFPDKQLFAKQSPPATTHINAVDNGEGDNLCLMRYFPLLIADGYQIIYEIRPGLVKLTKDSFPEICVKNISDEVPNFDYYVQLDDLPYIYQTDINTIPWTGSYIRTDPELVEKYKSCKGKIGICWSTGPKSGQWKERYLYRKSIPFDLLKPIISVDSSRFVAVQAGPQRLSNNTILDVLPKDERQLNWAETAALVENLDMVISIDTSVAHLAGAMGKPVWLMLSGYSHGWQFMTSCPDASWNESSPWYPSMKIFRQKERDNWSDVINRISSLIINVLSIRSAGSVVPMTMF